MATIVVPFRGASGKRRLAPAPEAVRVQLSLAMLGDVLAACRPVGETLLVSTDVEAARLARDLGASLVPDPGRGQGAAVEAAVGRARARPILVVNADLPCVRPRDLWSLLGALPTDGLALVPAPDGTTNALALAASHLFTPLYGPGSATRYLEHAERLGVETKIAEIPNLAEDVDTLADLERLEHRVGLRTRAALGSLRAGAAT